LASTGADRDIRTASGGFTYRIPLSLHILSRAQGRVLKGRIYDAETGEGIAHTLVSLGRTTVITDLRGRYTLPKPARGTEYLSVDRSTTGLDRISLVELPYAIVADGTLLNVLDIGFVRASSAEIEVVYDPSDRANKTSALGKKLKPGPQRGLLVEITDGERRVRRVTNSAGRVTFTDLIPGDWDVFIVGSRIPEGYRADPDTLHLPIPAGTRTEREIRIRPANKEIRLVGGTLSLSLGKMTDTPPILDSAPVDSEKEEASVNAAMQNGERLSEERRIHTVVEGQRLASIARAHYGSGIYWVRIWLANEDSLSSPDLIFPGQVLVLPPRGPLTDTELQTLRDYGR